MVKNKSFQIVILIIIISIVILGYVVLFRSQGSQRAPAGEAGKQQETTPQQGEQAQPVPGEQGAGAPQQEGSAQNPQETSPQEEGTPEGAVTGETAQSP